MAPLFTVINRTISVPSYMLHTVVHLDDFICFKIEMAFEEWMTGLGKGLHKPFLLETGSIGELLGHLGKKKKDGDRYVLRRKKITRGKKHTIVSTILRLCWASWPGSKINMPKSTFMLPQVPASQGTGK